MYEDWADMTFQPDWSKAAEDVEVRGDSTRSVHGRRQRLQASHPGTQVLCDSLGNLEALTCKEQGPLHAWYTAMAYGLRQRRRSQWRAASRCHALARSW